MAWKIVFVSFLLVFSVECGKLLDNLEVTPKIVNGTDADIADFPFIVSLQTFSGSISRHSCGGSILNQYWILTAAHCIYRENSFEKLIEYSTTIISDGSHGDKIAYVEDLIWHEGYSNSLLINDIGLVKLFEPLDIDLAKVAVKLPPRQYEVTTGDAAVLAGWGRLGSDLPISTTLQKVNLQMYSAASCALIHDPFNIHDSNICAGVPGGMQGQCSGKFYCQMLERSFLQKNVFS